ncbi:MAG: undecaprenyldiphospho-muramoylpentapeptide beta-N-acetylglucosaminyltransferase [Bacteroidales bacterium]|nr:undecaprenyldiphospho-muramoylpentapeptide beta-N-acetylglucosaminyltransferase [Bacteroidales bacterium]
MKPDKNIRILISGGGTGGHIFPAVSIADEIKRRNPEAEILFVGALGRMEMERVPEAGYKIVGLPISGFQRKLTMKNIKVIFDIVRSLNRSKKIIRDFKPHVAIGVGGYASGPVIRTAGKKGIPVLLQEQNNYAGVTNKLLAGFASKICVAYPGMEKFFPDGRIVETGNPVRNLQFSDDKRREGKKHFGLRDDLPVILVIGGSLGARTVNEAILRHLPAFLAENVQVIWQTGKLYIKEMEKRSGKPSELIRIQPFISDMELAYNAADLVISRAGAISISELCLAGKPALLIPSPNVAEDHQTKNAMALVNLNAAVMLKDSEAEKELGSCALGLLQDKEKCLQLSKNILELAKPKASEAIVDEVYKLINQAE